MKTDIWGEREKASEVVRNKDKEIKRGVKENETVLKRERKRKRKGKTKTEGKKERKRERERDRLVSLSLLRKTNCVLVTEYLMSIKPFQELLFGTCYFVLRYLMQ